MKKIVRTKLRTVQAFTPRGGTQLHNPNDNAAPEEPQDDPPASVQQQPFPQQPQRQNSGWDSAWSQPASQYFGPPYQPNHFTPQQQPAPYHNNAAQQSPPLQQGWGSSNQQQAYSPPYSPHPAQPPQNSPIPQSQPGYMNNSYDPSIHSGYAPSTQSAYTSNPSIHSAYDASSSSIHSQQQFPTSPPEITSSAPAMSGPQRTFSAQTTMQSQDPFYESPQPAFQRSWTMPAQTQTDWARGSWDGERGGGEVGHDCEGNRDTYV